MKKDEMWADFPENDAENIGESNKDYRQNITAEDLRNLNRNNDYEENREVQEPVRKKKRKKKTLTGSTFAKIVAFFLLTISFIVGAATVIISVYMLQGGVFDYGGSVRGREILAQDLMYEAGMEDASAFYYKRWPDEQKELEALLDEYCEGKNIQMEVWKIRYGVDEKPECILSNYEGYDTPYVYQRGFTEFETIEVEQQEETESVSESKKRAAAASGISSEGTTSVSVSTNEAKEVEVFYTLKVYVNPELPVYDEYSIAYNQAEILWQERYLFPAVALGSIFIFVFCFIFLMCAAGHKNGKEGITPGVLTAIHFDVLTVVFGLVAISGGILGVELAGNLDTLMALMLIIAVFALEVIWCTVYCMEVALRFKLGKWWKYTLIYVILRFIGRGIRFLWRAMISMIKGLPLIINTVILYVGICIVEFMGLCIWGRTGELVIVWFMEKILLFAVVIYIALVCKKLQEGSEALAEGNMNHKLDTSKMVLDFKEHGENLNRIGQGISKAVEARMKSEHMKTELITNVSHDIKTPLTSIINYADLLGHEAGKEEQLDKEKVAEYSEVLLRQSRRMKKLLEDLVEASKATTGSLEVNMEKCEVGVLLSQAVGEYEQRFTEKQLELITRQPEEPVWVMADGRRLWRVFDNLLNNICKYAQENTRVYVTVEKKEPHVEIIFRNMSKYALELTGEELEERFVRGDKSRHMEGNGLGLSIAKSLVELQNGSLEIVTDGDLFKVILRFPIL